MKYGSWISRQHRRGGADDHLPDVAVEQTQQRRLAYSLLNAIGAGLIVVSLLFDFNLSALLMEVFWVLISFVGSTGTSAESSPIRNSRWLNTGTRLQPRSASTCPRNGIHTSTWLTWPKDPETGPIGDAGRRDLSRDDRRAHAARDRQPARRRCETSNGARDVQSRHAAHSLSPHSNSRLVDSRLWTKLPDRSNGEVRFNDWIFNAWGNKYEELKKDDTCRALEPILK
jgi:hypothetical protein